MLGHFSRPKKRPRLGQAKAGVRDRGSLGDVFKILMWLGEGYEVRSVNRSKEGSDVSGSPNPDIQAASVRVLPHPIFFFGTELAVARHLKTQWDPCRSRCRPNTNWKSIMKATGNSENKHFQNHQMSLGRNGLSSLFNYQPRFLG